MAKRDIEGTHIQYYLIILIRGNIILVKKLVDYILDKKAKGDKHYSFKETYQT